MITKIISAEDPDVLEVRGSDAVKLHPPGSVLGWLAAAATRGPARQLLSGSRCWPSTTTSRVARSGRGRGGSWLLAVGVRPAQGASTSARHTPVGSRVFVFIWSPTGRVYNRLQLLLSQVITGLLQELFIIFYLYSVTISCYSGLESLINSMLRDKISDSWISTYHSNILPQSQLNQVEIALKL